MEKRKRRKGGNDQCIIFNFPANNSPWSVVGLLVHLEIFRCVRVFLAAVLFMWSTSFRISNNLMSF